MAASLRGLWLRMPRPKAFLGFMSLQTGTELISLSLLFNKITGVYGLLAILTGYALSAAQLSMYIYSVVVVVALAVLIPHLRRQSPFETLAFAWLYAVDTLINAAYTASFAVAWYLARLEAAAAAAAAANGGGGGSGTAAAAARIVQDVDTETYLGNGTARPAPAAAAPLASPPPPIQETAFSMVLIAALTGLVRAYCAVVVAAHARAVVQRFVAGRPGWDVDEARKGRVRNPFEEEDEEEEDEQDGGAGGGGHTVRRGGGGGGGGGGGSGSWRARFGGLMLSVGREYWLSGGREDEEWTRDVSSKFRSSARGQGTGAAPTEARAFLV